MHELLSGLETKRVLNSGPGIPKLDQYREYFLEWNDEEFIKICRMNKDSFLKLLRLIEGHAIFNNYSFIPQRDVHVQLAVTLRRLSHDGTGNSIEQIATLFGISKGSVTDYTNRCFKAITDNLQHLMRWPNKEQRERAAAAIKKQHFFRNCMGYIDGTHFRLSQKPTDCPESYHNRKGFYSVNCQVVCDERKTTLGFQSGQAGSMCDATCVEHASFMINREAKYFTCGDGASHEYLLGDSGYALHPFVLTPYRRPQVVSSVKCEDFNKVHSSARVAVENTIGVSKGKWRILKNIPIQINCEEDIMRIHELVHVCGLLHNYLILENDNFEGDFYEDVDVGQSRLDVVLLESLDNVNSVSSRILNAWRDSVADVVLADYPVHFGYDNE
ncbi:hypothetical protein INT47_003509 [Mucor saturninus]|uniref:Putative nuclease HARBI1 n=1 Tax=Mucor saturninus TaxID=64648 RepID=A0A8H7QKH0_9FUNG|nr:hypothetical protein INT47_003509 [Mucor saturninus]